jgi:hypothetical protein
VAISGSRPGEACHLVKDMSSCSVSFTSKFLPNFDLKNTILTYTQDFSCKKNPNSPGFDDLFLFPSQVARFLS